MINPLLVTAEQINAWSERIESSSLLPELVQRMLIETDVSIKTTFRTNSGTRYAGWDGRSVSNRRNGPVPKGHACWEVSVNKSSTRKANSDYEARTAAIHASERKKAHFIFVTTRMWSTRDDWADNKRSLREWKDVTALDAEAIYSWLLSCPLTHLWLTEQILGTITGVELLESRWRRISQATEPALTEELLLLGREEATKALIKQLNGRKPIVAVRSSSIEEALSFIYSTITLEDSATQPSRCLVVTDFDQLKRVAGNQTGLILIASTSTETDPFILKDKDNVLIRVLLQNEPHVEEEIEIERQSRYKLAEKFVEMGIGHERAQSLGLSLRKGLLYFQKECALDKSAIVPTWRGYSNPNFLLAVALIQEWCSDSHLELGIVAKIAGISEGDVESEFAKLKVAPDSCIREKGGVAYCVSPRIVFDEVAASLTSSFLNRYFAVAEEILYSPDPLAELNETALLAAQLVGVRPEISDRVTNGILNGLALLGTYAESGKSELCTQITTKCDSTISKVLSDIGSEPIGGRRVLKWLTLLAECSPEAFVGHFSRISEFDETAVEPWFSELERSIFFSPLRTQFLFALEVLSWSPEYFFRCAQILTRLCRFKIEDNWLNRPFNSLVGMFLYWCPGTMAALEHRVFALEWIHRYDAKLAVELLDKSLPVGPSSAFPTAKPKYRIWCQDDRVLRRSDAVRAWDSMSALLVEWALPSVDGCLGLVDRAGTLSLAQLRITLESVEAHVVGDQLQAGRVYDHLYAKSVEHRSYLEANWSMGIDRITLIEECIGRLSELIGDSKYRRLFRPFVELPNARADMEGHQKVVAQLRVAAVTSIWKRLGVDGLLRFAVEVESPFYVGAAMYDANIGISEVAMAMSELSEVHLSLIEGHLRKAAASSDSVPAFALLNCSELRVEFRCLALESLSWCENVYELLDAQDDDFRSAFWSSVKVPRCQSEDELLLVLSSLRNAQRPLIGLAQIPWQASGHSMVVAEEVAALLWQFASERIAQQAAHSVASFAVECSFKYLYGAGVDQLSVAKLEYVYFDFLRGSERQPQALMRLLITDAEEFASLARVAYSRGQSDVRSVERCSHAFSILGHLEESGKSFLNYYRKSEDLISFIDRVRAAAGDSDHAGVCDSILGQCFARAKDGWSEVVPALFVCAAIEARHSESLIDGFEVGLANCQGVQSRRLDSGGDAERSLSGKYRQAAGVLERDYPTVALVLRELATRYQKYGTHEDVRADLRMDRD